MAVSSEGRQLRPSTPPEDDAARWHRGRRSASIREVAIVIPLTPFDSEAPGEAIVAPVPMPEHPFLEVLLPVGAAGEDRSPERTARASRRDLAECARALLARERALFEGNGHPLTSRLEALRVIAHERRDEETERAATFALGILNREQGAWAAAFETFESVRQRTYLPGDAANCLLEQGLVRLEIGPPDRVVRLCARALRMAAGEADTLLIARIRLLAAETYLRAGDPVRVQQCCDRLRESSLPEDAHEIRCVIRRVEADRLRLAGRPDAAMLACAEACALASERLAATAAGRSLLTSILRRWALLALERGDLAGARKKAAEAAASLPASDRIEAGRLSFLSALIDLEEGDEEAARDSLQSAEQAFRATRQYLDLAQLLLLSGEVSALREASFESRAAGREGIFEARGLFRRLGRDREVRRCDLFLDTLRRDRWSDADGRGPGAAHPPRVPRVRRLSQLGYITADPGILRALEPIESLARTPIPVLILGESGTGKEVLARALHKAAGGRGPFLPVNCGALPTDLQESELFGHVRGAFTGAVADKAGLFEAADGGTLLLDEVGEMSLRAQVKLLRVLELGEVRRVGETRTRRVHVRVVAATNADLKSLIRSNRFRRDLYYRLCGLSLELPPLRSRLGDIPLLAAHFAALFGNQDGPALAISSEAMDRLLRHSWPGNIRELRFCLEKASALTRALFRPRIEADCIDIDTVSIESVPAPAPPPPQDPLPNDGLDAYMENMERRLIVRALEDNGWNRTRAARALGGMSRTTLIGKMKRLGLFPTQSRKEDAEPEGGPISMEETVQLGLPGIAEG
jgi:two-component system, NtrC family, response regulator PilR